MGSEAVSPLIGVNCLIYFWQARLLHSLGVCKVQGYFLTRPLPLEAHLSDLLIEIRVQVHAWARVATAPSS